MSQGTAIRIPRSWPRPDVSHPGAEVLQQIGVQITASEDADGAREFRAVVTYRALSKADLSAGSVIGTPLADLELYLLDPRRQPVPVGVAGEIYVGGGGVARGYRNRPELTAERFVAHPFRSEPGARLYRTGDRGRFLPGRDLEYLGRIDDQIKIRGFRIEPGEIEAVLKRHPSVRQALVVARGDKPRDKRLAAYLVATQPAPDREQLRIFLRTELPDYMVPAHFVFLEKMPLTRNGKIDRRALPAPETTDQGGGKDFVAPRTRLERTVARIWEDLLGVERVGLHDNFFEMGGHSLLLVQFQYRLQTALNRHVPVTTLFQHPTLSALARHLSDAISTRGTVQERVRRMREMQPSIL